MTKVREQGDDRQEERLRLVIEAPGLSTWQRFCPVEAWRDPALLRMEAYLDKPATRVLFDEHEDSEDYPEPVLSALRKLGLPEIISPRKGTSATVYHMSALNALAARRNTSVAVTLSVNFLGLLPAYLAANEEQIETISKRIEAGNFAALLLSELAHGSNILRNQARADRGVLDAQGHFVAVGEEEPCTHYRLNGEKHLINGATRHGLMFVCLRTRNFEIELLAEIKEPMKARGDFTLFWLERGPGMTAMPRYHTLPARAADISGLRLQNCIVEADHVIGREHGGLAVIHKTLVLSRGGVAALASGCLGGALDLALTYARRRNVYGRPIVHLGAISDHLIRMQALDLLVSAISLKATCFLNGVGLAASHYTSVAKLMACELAEEGVREGQRVLGARSLLRELPYERWIRDVNLYGIFDGTSHVMLEELSSRLAHEAKETDTPPSVDLDDLRTIYGTTPRPVTEVLREFRRPVLFPMVEHLCGLDRVEGRRSLSPLVKTAIALFALVRHLRKNDQWKQDQGRRLAAAEVFAMLEVLIACCEVCDPERRTALGMPPPAQFDEDRDRALYDFAFGWFGSRAVSRMRQLLLQSSLPQEELKKHLARLGTAERDLLRDQDETRSLCREQLCAPRDPADPSRARKPARPQPSRAR